MANPNSKSDANKANNHFDPSFVQIAKVKDNRDPSRSGKLKVWVKQSQSAEDDSDSWIVCRYASIFAGRTEGSQGGDAYEEFPKSYGFWAVPPDVNTEVAIFFANGDQDDAYWFACSYQEGMNATVPSTSTGKLADSGQETESVVTSYNRNQIQSDTSDQYLNVPLTAGLTKQGLLYDPVKGIGKRSSNRAVISSLYGWNTPRGQTIVLDDGYKEEDTEIPTWDDDDSIQDTQYNNPANETKVGQRTGEGIILRTRSGGQIIISESDGFVFIINRDGTARIEMTEDGQITVHSDKSMSFRTEEDFNFSAARNINFESNNVNFNTSTNVVFNTGSNFNIKAGSQFIVNSGSELRLVSGSSARLQASSVDILSSGTIACSASSTNNITGSSVNISGGGTNLTVASDVSTNASFNGADFKTPSASLSEHIHDIADWSDARNHGSHTNMARGGGKSGTTQKATPAAAGNDIAPQEVESYEVEVVEYIEPTSQISETVQQDMPDNKGKSYEILGMVMPVTGQIREYGYYGRNLPTETASTEDREGWIIQANSEVLSVLDGTVTSVTDSRVIVTHLNGYKTIYNKIKPSVTIGTEVSKGSSIGSVTGIMTFVVKRDSALDTGFAGSVDPGMFFESITGLGIEASNKGLTAGQSSIEPSEQKKSTPSESSTEEVKISKVKTISSSTPQRGSKRTPVKSNKKGKKSTTFQGNDSYHQEDLSNIDKTPSNWVVQASDPMLVEGMKIREGNAEYQATKGYFRNNKFYAYPDLKNTYTIGYGHQILPKENFSSGITEAQAEEILLKDLANKVDAAKRRFAAYNLQVPYMCQLVMVEMAMALGNGGAAQFVKFHEALAKQDYKKAANELRDSLAYRQIPNRFEFLARRVEACA